MSIGYDATASSDAAKLYRVVFKSHQPGDGAAGPERQNTRSANNPQALYGQGGFGGMTNAYSAAGALTAAPPAASGAACSIPSCAFSGLWSVAHRCGFVLAVATRSRRRS